MHEVKELTLAQLAQLTGSRVVGNPNHRISNVADLEEADAHDVAFLANPRYAQAMLKSNAGAVFVDPKTALVEGRNFLLNENPSQAFQKVLDTFHVNSSELSGFTGIHPTAVIHDTCQLGQNVTVGPFAVLDKDTKIGNNTFIGSHCYVGLGTTIGSDCILHPRVTVREHCSIKNHVILQPGVVIGSCGFGYLTDKQGRHTKLNQVGSVTIEDNVEIGANTTIDRARFKTTRIGQGTKIDNLVQIAHGVLIGSNNIIIAQTGIAGSAETGKSVILAGQTAVAGHIKLADGVILSARSGASKSITQPGKYGGVPAIPLHEYNRINVYLRNIETFVKELRGLRGTLSP
jgi:UDP-3-O-[3-hydroxymyristoyl] glucosamine N-acyltransferase